MLGIEIIRRVSLARHLFELGLTSLRGSNDLSLFSAVNLMQDAVEAFLLAIGDHVAADIPQRSEFDKYFVAINEKVAPWELPFKAKLLRMNRIRVESKHHGIQPDRNECKRMAVAAREFFDEVTKKVLGSSFATVSTIDLLDEGEVKQLLVEARDALDGRDYRTVAINCRKVLFLTIEKDYSIYKFRTDTPEGGLAGLMSFSFAPYYCRSKEYVDRNVRTPTDFIVIDHSHLDAELVKMGAQPEGFWNIHRLTPALFRYPDKTWVVRDEFSKLNAEELVEDSEYIFSATLDLLLCISEHRRRQRWRTGGRRWTINLQSEEIPLYDKADDTSGVSALTPKGVLCLNTQYREGGLHGDAMYYYVTHAGDDAYISGFIHERDVRFDD